MRYTLLRRKVKGIIAIGVFGVLTAATAVAAEYHNPAISGRDTAAYWIDRGGLLSTYGNFPAAVTAYQKSLTLEPNNSEAHFDLGLAYGEMGAYGKALANISKAITLAPDNGRFYYGRAWIMILSGRAGEAEGDMAKAAHLGNTDAHRYLVAKQRGH